LQTTPHLQALVIFHERRMAEEKPKSVGFVVSISQPSVLLPPPFGLSEGPGLRDASRGP
jgi:hypothetical protein